jgi:L-ascorbate metabolism protein UlaG (beta-lactamase superfamily)
MDHMDLPSLTRFAQTTPVIPAALTSDILRCTGLKKIREMRWDDKHRVQTDRGDIEIEAVEVNHWGRRWPNEKIDRGYNGYIIRRERKALLFAGDTARTTLFADLCARGPFEAAVMPIGAYNPWIRSHCTPEQAVEMANAAGAKYFVPVHHQTFKLSDESMSEPIERLQKALSDEPDRIALRRVGETVVSPNA